MPNKQFLEEYPLYKKFSFEIEKLGRGMYGITLGTVLVKLPKPAINMHCPICKSMQTFNMVGEYYDDINKKRESSPAFLSFQLNYFCSSCKTNHYEFFIDFGVNRTIDKDKNEVWSNGWVRKIGQRPEWSIEVDKQLQGFLSSTNTELFKRGLVCESQSYGIGAYSYYRRVTEAILADLLVEIETLVPEGKDKVKYTVALEKTKKEIVASNKLALIKDLLPSDLLTEGYNPLDVIYSAISDGLHNWTDEECLDISEAIRKCLEFLVVKVYVNKAAKKNFTAGMKRLLSGKFKK
jgi:hypothetical protein